VNTELLSAGPDLTFREVASMGHISHRTVRRLVQTGKLVAVRHNSKVVRIPYASWKEYRESLQIMKA
jgi:excisionase family DNA binding protein